jgi:hypothetical protein
MNSKDKKLNIEHESERIAHPSMQYYRHVFQHSVRWDGDADLRGKKVLVYMEQGYGDCIQFLRYIPTLVKTGCVPLIYCQPELHPLCRSLVQKDASKLVVFDKNDPDLPEHDFHVLSMSLPFLLSEQLPNVAAHTSFPYLQIPGFKKDGLDEFNGKRLIGICWEGSDTNPANTIRSCELKNFQELGTNGILFSLQKFFHNSALLLGCENMELYSDTINGFLDTAKLILKMDCVVTVDTCVVHLAGALNVPTFLLLTDASDGRYGTHGHNTRWYPSVTVYRMSEHNYNWPKMFEHVKQDMLDLFFTPPS